jgi:hypothetical protein
MPNKMLHLLLTAMTCAMGLTQASSTRVSAQATDTAEVFGRVSDWLGCSLPGASVSVTDQSGRQIATTRTGSDGTYRLSNLVGTDLHVSAAVSGFVKISRAKGLVRGVNQWDIGLPLGLEHDTPIHIAGTIQDESGRGIASATVTVHSVFEEQRLMQARSGADGTFNIDVYEPGQYVVYAAAPARIGAAVAVQVPNGATDEGIRLVLKPSSTCR